MRSFDEIVTGDPRALIFARLGTNMNPRTSVEASIEDWQEVMERIALADDVADQTRASFDDLRHAFIYGVFCYEIFTIVEDRALFVLEQALRDRFVELHRGNASFEVDDKVTEVAATEYGMVFDFLRANSRRKVRLLIRSPHAVRRIEFDGLLDDLRQWARHCGLLAGQRTKTVEDVLARMRNEAAHPNGYHLTTPVEAARTLNDLAEILNHLWGHRTPGGRLYPAPIERDTVVIGWSLEQANITWSLAANLVDASDWSSYSHLAIVQATWPGPGSNLSRYDSLYETINDPTDYLWGPGSYHEATRWLRENGTRRDTAKTFGRTFAIRQHDGRLYLPMRPEVAATQPTGHRAGHWHLVGADTPTTAFAHVRSLYSQNTRCTRARTCPACYATNLREGTLASLVANATAGAGVQRPPDFYVHGGIGSGIRYIEL